jgi:DNA helicase-2/ATP-dependent DNA helicase PcrA
LIDVSTIHDCVWDIIAPHQIQLIEIHRDKLVHEVDGIKSSLETENWAEKYRLLSEEKQSLLLEIMSSKKLIYYKHKQDNAPEFKAEFSNVNERFPGLLSNVNNFKKMIDRLFRIHNYEEAIAKIDEKEFTKVKYDARFNDDRLEKMRISHDTLLEYTQKLVCMNDILKQIICDQYPFVLVDEYQDTNPLVIKTLSSVDEYAKMIAHTFLVGYYGDVKQNIYNNGVGSHFRSIHKDLERVEKVFNRRCSPEIITIANNIRTDGLIQKSIYDEFPDSSVSFFNMEVDRQELITEYIKKWNIDEKNKLHCFELTNERVAEQSDFPEIYNYFKNSKWYKIGKRYEFLRDHVLSLDENKLGVVQRLLFRILDFRYKLVHDATMLVDVFHEKYLKDVNVFTLRKLLEKMQKISGETLEEYVTNIFNAYRKDDEKYDKCIEYYVPSVKTKIFSLLVNQIIPIEMC